MNRLDKKIAVVTGAAGGIGAEICDRFRGEGAQVAGLDRMPPENADLNLACDLSSTDEIDASAKQVSSDLGTPDIVVHCAAMTEFTETLAADETRFHDIMSVNVYAAMRLAQRFAPDMRQRGSGNFVFISSITGIVGAPGLASYSSSKGALNTLTRTLALEMAPSGIRVNSICPASIDTPLLRASFEKQPDPAKALADNILRHPLGRLGTPRDVANLALFLASDEAAWITGTTMRVDGGATINRR